MGNAISKTLIWLYVVLTFAAAVNEGAKSVCEDNGENFIYIDYGACLELKLSK